MIRRTDWMPAARNARLAMAESWGEFVSEKRELWEIPASVVAQLAKVTLTAKNLIAIPESSRDAVTNAHLRNAFEELEATMRNIKKRYFYNPPLIDADFIALGLKPKDTTPTPVPAPKGQAEADIVYPGKTQLQLRIKHVEGTPVDAKADYGHRIFYGIYNLNDAQPSLGKELPKSRFTRQKKALFGFKQNDSGKKAFFCIRYENSKGDAGPWGPMFSAVIP